MSDLREPLDSPPPASVPAETRGTVDVERIKTLHAIGDRKALDPGTPPYDPRDHVIPRSPTDPPTAGLDRPVLLNLSAKVHAAAAERFEPRVGGVSETPPFGRLDPVVGGHEADESIVDDAYRNVPCAERRPRWVYEVGGSEEPLIESEAHAIDDAHSNVAEVLREAGAELTADDVQEALQYVNPTDGRQNCVECSMAVDDILDGRPAVAGPTPGQPPYELRAALSLRSFEYLENVTPTEVERLLDEAGAGARGIVVGWQNQVPVHAYNVANVGGDVYWLDGQQELMTEHDPHGFRSLEFYLTGVEGEQ